MDANKNYCECRQNLTELFSKSCSAIKTKDIIYNLHLILELASSSLKYFQISKVHLARFIYHLPWYFSPHFQLVNSSPQLSSECISQLVHGTTI